MPREGKKPPSSQALALLYLRSKRDWSQRELADRLGWADEKQVSRYERGGRELSRKTLETAAEVLGYPPEAVEALLFIGRWIEPEASEEPPSPEPLSPGVRRAIDRSCLTQAWSFLDGWRSKLVREATRVKVERARRKAQELWARLKSATRQDRREAVGTLPEFQSWALAERVCEASICAAAHKPEDALDLADLALFIAQRVEGDEGWRLRLEAYCWAHIGNARRVANDYANADKTFVRVWKLWGSSNAGDPDLFPQWRVLDLEASLRREERRFSEALDLLDRALAANKAGGPAIGHILLNKEFVFDQMGDHQGALESLKQAIPFVKASGNKRLIFALRFKIANNLCQLGRCQEALKELPQVRELAEDQGNELDLIRVLWLEARVLARQGKADEAALALDQVRRDFTARGLPYDAALASLDLAILWLESKRTADVRNLARTLAWVFQAHGVTRDALAALALFRDAAQRETVTVELVQRVIADLERANPPAPPQWKGRG
ncbi:MAG TPA: helix-turn-helix domain-containing protein [Thermoanaerobaculia bacterium]|jgi:transcriptional regulator with XRE-family HTH domain